jgi:predicted deacylase
MAIEPVKLKVKTIEGQPTGPHLLITGGIHGDEFEPMAAIRRLIGHLRPDEIRGRVTLCPVVNEAAFLHGDRTAEDELDLARVCPGKTDGSVTERTAFALSELIRSADFYIDLHTGGTGLAVWPMAGYCLHPQAAILGQQRKMAQAFNLPFIWGTAATLEGRSLSIARHANVPAIYSEYMGSAVCDPNGVEAYVAGCLNVMGSLGMIERELPPSRVEHVVENPIPDSGHMQVQNRSPITGFFEPAVELGQFVECGRPLGTVSDTCGDRIETVDTQEQGIVLVLRTFSRVLEGESLGVVVDVERFAVEL